MLITVRSRHVSKGTNVMGVLNVLRIAGSALTAQRLRMDVTSSNIANAETTRSPEGGPYRRSRVVFAAMSQPASSGDAPPAAT